MIELICWFVMEGTFVKQDFPMVEPMQVMHTLSFGNNVFFCFFTPESEIVLSVHA